MTSNGSHSDGTGYTPTSPTPTTSPSLFVRSISTPITSIYMSDSDSATRESDARDSTSRPTRERKTTKHYVAGVANQSTTFTQPTASSAARSNARRTSTSSSHRATSTPSTGIPATHSIRRHSRQDSNSNSIPSTTPLPLPVSSVRPDLRQSATFAPESPQAPGAFVPETRTAPNSPIQPTRDDYIPQSPPLRPRSAAELIRTPDRLATPSRAARLEEFEVDHLLTRPGLRPATLPPFLADQDLQSFPPTTSRISRAHFSSTSQFSAIPEDEMWDGPSTIPDPRDDVIRRTLRQLEEPEIEGEPSLRSSLEGWATGDTQLEDFRFLPNGAIMYLSPTRPEDVSGLILTLQEIINAVIRLEGTRSKPYDLRGVDTLWHSFVHGHSDAYVIENIYKRRTLRGLAIFDKTIRRLRNEVVISPATTATELDEDRRLANASGDLQRVMRLYSEKTPMVYHPRSPDSSLSSLLFKGTTPSFPSIQDKEDAFFQTTQIPLPPSTSSSPSNEQRNPQSPLIVMATTTTTTSMPGLVSTSNVNAPSSSTPSTIMGLNQAPTQPSGGSSLVQVTPATPIRGDRLGIPVTAPSGVAVTPRTNVQWNNVTPGLASISTGLPSAIPGQPTTVNLPAPLYSSTLR